MATNVSITSNYIPDNIINSDSTTSIGSSSSSGEDTPERILEKLLTVDSDDSTLNANTLQGKTAADFATPASVAAAVAALVDSSPQALDTLNELAAAMGDDPNFAATVTNALSNKVDKSALLAGVTTNSVTVINGGDLNLQAPTGDEDSGDIVFKNGSGVERHRIFDGWGYQSGTLAYRANAGAAYKLYHSGNVNLPTVDWAANNINANGLIRAYRYATATNLPAITMDKSGSYAYGIGPDGTNMRVRYGTAGLDGSAWYSTGNAGIEHFLDGKLTVTGDIQGDTTFISGFQGSGMRLNKDANNKYNLELDNLIVRGGMSVYELTVNKVRATNGALYVSDSGKIKSVSDGGTYFVTYLEDVNTFVAGDVVKCQIFTGSGVKSYIFKVEWTGSNASGDYVAFTKSTCWLQGGTGVNIPAVGDTIVRIGNNIDTNRQGTIYLTASDTNSPYIQVVDGATSTNLAGDVKVRLGKLDGITSTDFGNLSGYGLYTNNAVLDNARVSGNISADSGNIGKFYIEGDYLGNDNIQMYNPNPNEGYIRFRIEENTADKHAGILFESLNLFNRTTVDRGSMKFYYELGQYIVEFKAPDMYLGHFTETNSVNIAASDYVALGSDNQISINATNGVTITATAIQVNGNQTVSGNFTANGTSTINRATTTLTYNTVGAWSSFSSLTFNGRREGKTNALTLTFYSSNSSASWQKLGTITNYVSTGYNVYFTPTTGTGLGENSVGYIATTGEIFIMPGKGGQNYYGQVTWITA